MQKKSLSTVFYTGCQSNRSGFSYTGCARPRQGSTFPRQANDGKQQALFFWSRASATKKRYIDTYPFLPSSFATRREKEKARLTCGGLWIWRQEKLTPLRAPSRASLCFSAAGLFCGCVSGATWFLLLVMRTHAGGQSLAGEPNFWGINASY